MTSKAYSLYIHVPFCRSKCPYCAFNSFCPREGETERWCNCTIRQLKKIREELPSGSLAMSIYFGGGTPSLLSLDIWRRILDETARFPRQFDCEFTIEANPESLNAEKLALWRHGGVSRVSIGVQSLDDAELKMLARPHTAAEALQKIEMCLKQSFRVSADLIFGLPRQTLRRWHENMSRLVDTGIGHLSVYQLSIEEKSFWGRHTPENLPDGYSMYRWAQYYLPRCGLKQYEISSFAVPGQESRHNTAYWKRTDVYAAGPGAWGFVAGRRFANCADFSKWAKCVENDASPVDYEECLTGAAAASEAAVLALRTADGINFADFSRRYGEKWLNVILRRWDDVPTADLHRTKNSVALSPRGMRVGNAIWSQLIDLDE